LLAFGDPLNRIARFGVLGKTPEATGAVESIIKTWNQISDRIRVLDYHAQLCADILSISTCGREDPRGEVDESPLPDSRKQILYLIEACLRIQNVNKINIQSRGLDAKNALGNALLPSSVES
jgi:hypothetical protein